MVGKAHNIINGQANLQRTAMSMCKVQLEWVLQLYDLKIFL